MMPRAQPEPRGAFTAPLIRTLAGWLAEGIPTEQIPLRQNSRSRRFIIRSFRRGGKIKIQNIQLTSHLQIDKLSFGSPARSINQQVLEFSMAAFKCTFKKSLAPVSSSSSSSCSKCLHSKTHFCKSTLRDVTKGAEVGGDRTHLQPGAGSALSVRLVLLVCFFVCFQARGRSSFSGRLQTEGLRLPFC